MIFEPAGESPIYGKPDEGVPSLQECELPKPIAIENLNPDFLAKIARYVGTVPESAGHSLFRRWGTPDIIDHIAGLGPDDAESITLRKRDYAHAYIDDGRFNTWV